MSRAEQQETRATYLLGLLCDERLRDEEAMELAELLATSDAVRVAMSKRCNYVLIWPIGHNQLAWSPSHIRL